MMSDNYARNKKMEDGDLDRNELCTLEIEWSPSVSDFINILLHNEYGVKIEPIFDAEGKLIYRHLLVTIMGD